MHVNDVIYSLFWVIILLALILRWRLTIINGLSSSVVAILFAIKACGALALQCIYTYYYTDRSTADIYRFFDDGVILNSVTSHSLSDFFKIIFNLLQDESRFKAMYFEEMNAWIKPFESGFYNDNHFMIKLNSLISFISSNTFEVHNQIFTAAAFIGLILLVKTLINQSRNSGIALAIGTLLPSSLLMMSGGLKESVMILGAGLLFYGLLSGKIKSFQKWTTLLVGLICLLSVKPYFIASASAALVVFFLCNRLHLKSFYRWGIWGGVILFGGLIFHLSDIDLVEAIVNKRHEFMNHAQDIHAGSSFVLTQMQSSWVSILLHIPEALLNAILRPFPWNVNGLPETLMLFENIIFLVVVTMSLINTVRHSSTSKYAVLCIQTAVPVLILIGLISPVLGATMRYRGPFLLIVIIALTPYLFPNKSSVSNHP